MLGSWGKVVRIRPLVVEVAGSAEEGSGRTSIQQEVQWELSLLNVVEWTLFSVRDEEFVNVTQRLFRRTWTRYVVPKLQRIATSPPPQ